MKKTTDSIVTGNTAFIWWIILGFAVIKGITPWLIHPSYDHHIDGYLHAVLAEKPAWGYISVPPSIMVFAKLALGLFGHHETALLFFPALFGALSVIVLGASVIELGGRKTAVVISCTTFLITPAFLRSNLFFTPNPFDQFYWLLISWLTIRLVRTGNTKLWIPVGIAFGLAFMNKYAVAFFGLALFVALIISSHRKLLWSGYLLWGMLCGAIIVFPNILWQANHHWPVLYHMDLLYQYQLTHTHIGEFLIMQLLMNAPALIFLILGFVWLMTNQTGKPFRFLLYLYFILILEMILLKGKFYYIIGIYSILIAVGSIAIEQGIRRGHRWVSIGAIGWMVVIGIAFIPITFPLFPVERMARMSHWMKSLGVVEPLRWNDGEIHDIPHDFAIMTGMKDLANLVEDAYSRLDPDEQRKTMVFCTSYGLASVTLFYTSQKELPEPVCFEDTFILWAPGEANPEVLIYVNREPGSFPIQFSEITFAGEVKNPFSIFDGVKIFVCKHPSPEFPAYYQRVAASKKAPFH